MRRKTFVPVLLTVLTAIAAAAASHAGAQSHKIDGARGSEVIRWEYAAISNVREIGRGAATPNIRFTGEAELCYFQESGCKKLNIEGVSKVEALAKAMARLGEEGWELVGESPFPLNVGSQGALFFKRPKS